MNIGVLPKNISICTQSQIYETLHIILFINKQTETTSAKCNQVTIHFNIKYIIKRTKIQKHA